MSDSSRPAPGGTPTVRQEFYEWFIANYPPGCVISKPEWHAEKIAMRFVSNDPAARVPSPGAPTENVWRCTNKRSHGICNAFNDSEDKTCGACGEDRPSPGADAPTLSAEEIAELRSMFVRWPNARAQELATRMCDELLTARAALAKANAEHQAFLIRVAEHNHKMSEQLAAATAQGEAAEKHNEILRKSNADLLAQGEAARRDIGALADFCETEGRFNAGYTARLLSSIRNTCLDILAARASRSVETSNE